jgi:hypothetical protein
MEAGPWLFAVGLHVNIGNARIFGAAMAGANHVVDLGSGAGEHRLNGSVAAVTNPTVETTRLRLLHRPGAEPDALDGAGDKHMNDFAVGHRDSSGKFNDHLIDR